MYFEQAAVDIRGLPKLEGTVHVNIALIVKFMPNFFFAPAECPEIPRRDDAADDAFLFVYAQLILENTRLYAIAPDLVEQIFDFMVRDFADGALQLHGKAASTPAQMRQCLQVIAKLVTDEHRYDAVWKGPVLGLDGAYEMNA